MKGRIKILLGIIVFIQLSGSAQIQQHSGKQTRTMAVHDDKAQWDKADSLNKAGLPAQALEIVNNIADNSLTGNNMPVYLKAVLYQVMLKSQFEPDYLLRFIAETENALQKKPEPSKQFMHSILAELYWKYYSENQYKTFDRTRLPEGIEEDMQLWDAAAFIRAISGHFTASLANDELLKNTNLKDYDVLLETEPHSKQYRPTLYDFLASRALEFYNSHQAGIAIPQMPFQLNDAAYFDDAATFTALELTSTDTLSFVYQGTRIYQQLLAWRLSRPDTLAFVDAELHRLEFVRQHSALPGVDSLYLNALLRLEKEYTQHPAAADILFAIASAYADENSPEIYPGYVSGSGQSVAGDLVKAHLYCEKAIQKFPNTLGAKNCSVLKQQIESVSINFQLPETVIPGKAFPLYLQFKNSDTVWFKIIKSNPDEPVSSQYGLNSPESLAILNELKPVLKWKVILPAMRDFSMHSVDVIMPELEKGYYTLMASNNETFKISDNNLSVQQFHVTQLSLVSYREQQGSGVFYVLDRESGEGLKDVKVQSFTMDYDYRQRVNIRRNQQTYRTSADGSFTIDTGKDKRGKSLSFDMQKGDDRYVINNAFGLYPAPVTNSRPQTKTWFFTDRSIYRPGQVIYFKGLMINSDNHQYTPEVKKATTVHLYDINGSKVASLDFKTNAFGSFSGEFTLPLHMAGGSIRLGDEYGSAFVRVEEYKQPQFEVKLQSPDETYKLGEHIRLKGQAISYSNVPLPDAEVSYRIVRNAWFPYPLRYSRRPIRSPQAEISSGKLITVADGNFNIDFIASTGKSEVHDPYTVYNFIIYVTVTDINGETHSAETVLNVSNRALIVRLNMDDVLDKGDLPIVKFSTTNLSGETVSAAVQVELAALTSGNLLLHNRVTPVPDTSLYSREAWHQKLPHEPYGNEGSRPAEVEAVVRSATLQSTTDSLIPAAWFKELKPGRYRLKLSTVDTFGDKVEMDKEFVLTDQSSRNLAEKTFSFFKISKQQAVPGETLILTLGSSVKNANIYYRIDYQHGNIANSQIKLSEKQTSIKIPILETYRGNISVSAFMVVDNHVYTHQALINVPFEDKKLDFEFGTFRSQLLPGTSEEWRIKIRDAAGTPVSAEFLAAMYDASLDAISPHQWYFSLYKPVFNASAYDASKGFETLNGLSVYSYPSDDLIVKSRLYDKLNWFGFYPAYGLMNDAVFMRRNKQMAVPNRSESVPGIMEESANSEMVEVSAVLPEYSSPPDEISFRKNLNETAFFYPQLEVSGENEYIVKFTVPEALTLWKFMGFAHTTDLKTGLFTKEVITRKNLMVTPNLPRFVRQGDTIVFTARISNLTGLPIQGQATLELFDALSMSPVDAKFGNQQPMAVFEAAVAGTTVVAWKIVVSEDARAVVVRISAKAGKHTDGEEHIVPVLSNRMLVTETLPLPINGHQTKEFNFDRLRKLPAQSKTLRNQGLTLEFTSNPAWLALQSLPVLMEPEYDNSDAVFRMYYANALAHHIAQSNPAFRRVFEVWRQSDPNTFLSNLEKNPELKSIVLNETPWMIQAASESTQKQRLALLFDENTMQASLNSAVLKLQQQQTVNGGWPWFEGYRESRYITQQVVAGFGKLHYLKVIDVKENVMLKQMIVRAVDYLTNELMEDYRNHTRKAGPKKDSVQISPIQIYYLYSLSYLLDVVEIPETAKSVVEYYGRMARAQWQKSGLSMQAMIALWAGRNGDAKTAGAIIRSLRDRAIVDEEIGMYWRDNVAGFSWERAPIQTQALLIELFEETANDREAADLMRTWLIKQKQVQAWPENSATAEAVYALLIRGTSWLSTSPGVTIKLGDKTIDPSDLPDVKAEAGTGYFKTHWSAVEIDPGMSKIVVTKSTDGPAWGALYWQYFEQLDKITAHQSPLSLKRELFVKRNSEAGPVLEPVKENKAIAVGDQLVVRMVLTTDRDLNFVHLKDMRAPGFEPIAQLSGYTWKGGLGYYQTARDVSGDFFFDYLPRGTWVIEYPVMVTLKGSYSAGIGSVQCMYAPEFAAHSSGVRVMVE